MRELTMVLGGLGGRYAVSTVRLGPYYETMVFPVLADGEWGDELDQIRSPTSAHAETVARWERALTEVAGVPMLAVPVRQGARS